MTDFGGQNIAPKKIEITRFHRRVNKRATTQEDLKDEQMRFVAVKIILVATLLAACSGSNADSGALGDKSEESESGHSILMSTQPELLIVSIFHLTLN